MSTTEAIRIGTATTGRLITAAALVLAVVAGAFVFSDLVMMKYLAFGLLIALLLDATVVRMFLVPAIMKLLGDDCWWAPMWMKRLQHKIGMGETTLPDERKRAVLPEPEEALVGVAVSSPRQRVAAGGSTALATEPVSAPVEEAPTTRFASPQAREERDIGSWLGELRRKASTKRPAGAERGPDPSAEPTNVLASGEPTNVISASDDATTAIPMAIPTAIPTANALSAEETRAIPVSRPQTADSDVATEQLNARGQHSGGGVSAADLLRREGRL
jgi:RND superfamily putative drug exporter